MRSSRCEWRRAWTIGRLTGRLPDPVARHVGDDAGTGKSEILRNAGLTSPRPLQKNNRRSRQPPLSHFGRPSVAPSPAARHARRASMGYAMDGFATLDLSLFAAGAFAAWGVTG